MKRDEDFCKGCAFWAPIDELEPSEGECRRNPPFRNQRHKWTWTKAHDWCGEWQWNPRIPIEYSPVTFL